MDKEGMVHGKWFFAEAHALGPSTGRISELRFEISEDEEEQEEEEESRIKIKIKIKIKKMRITVHGELGSFFKHALGP